MQTTDPRQGRLARGGGSGSGLGRRGSGRFRGGAIPADKIVATHDVDVVVAAWDRPATLPPACAEQGLKPWPWRSRTAATTTRATIGGTNSELHKFWGMEYDTTEWMSDAMIGCSFQADMTLYQHYLEKNGEAVNWYISHFDNQDFNDYPLTFAAGDFPDFREQYDPTALSRSWNTSLNLPYPPGELADILAGSSPRPASRSATRPRPASW